MNLKITPGLLHGAVEIPPSKSQAHRLMICAALADAPTRLICPAGSEDIDATADCLTQLGASVARGAAGYDVTPIVHVRRGGTLCCRESGSTLRLLLPVAAALGSDATFFLRGRLPQRPLEPLWSELVRGGCALSRPQPDQIMLRGALREKRYRMAANVSSQFFSGLAFALPLLSGGEVQMLGELESAGYLNMTLAALERFGVQTALEGDALRVGAGRYRSPGAAAVEADWSSASFWLCANAMGSRIDCRGLENDSQQPDRFVTQAIAEIARPDGHVGARQIPDLIPVLAVLACTGGGVTTFHEAQRLRLKESDRIASTLQMLASLGAEAEPTPDGLRVRASGILRGGVVDSCGDHRIAMSAAIAACICSQPVTILGAECAAKSYPAFWQHYRALGGVVEEVA